MFYRYPVFTTITVVISIVIALMLKSRGDRFGEFVSTFGIFPFFTIGVGILLFLLFSLVKFIFTKITGTKWV
jgi:hypothetical protein